MKISVRRKVSHFWSVFDAQRLRHRRRWPWEERTRNACRAFASQRDFSGATLNEFARVLCKAGAIRVDRWVAARTLSRWCRSNYLRQSIWSRGGPARATSGGIAPYEAEQLAILRGPDAAADGALDQRFPRGTDR
jgi:hypothetical protein